MLLYVKKGGKRWMPSFYMSHSAQEYEGFQLSQLCVRSHINTSGTLVTGVQLNSDHRASHVWIFAQSLKVVKVQGVSKKGTFPIFVLFRLWKSDFTFHMCFGIRISSPFHLATQSYRILTALKTLKTHART